MDGAAAYSSSPSKQLEGPLKDPEAKDLTSVMVSERNAQQQGISITTVKGAQMADNIDNFNLVVSKVFSSLYASFPVPRHIHTIALIRDLGFEPTVEKSRHSVMQEAEILKEWPDFPNGTNIGAVYRGAMDWLQSEGFIRQDRYGGWVLTAVALSALNAQPDSLKEPLGKRLTSVATGVGTEAGRSAVNEIIGQVIASVARGVLGG